MILRNFIWLRAFTVHMENSLRFEISLRSIWPKRNLHRSEFHYTRSHANADNKVTSRRSKILPQSEIWNRFEISNHFEMSFHLPCNLHGDFKNLSHMTIWKNIKWKTIRINPFCSDYNIITKQTKQINWI